MLNQDYKDILSAFNDEKVNYMVVGAYAVAAHGVVRATGDIDLWISSSLDNARRAWRALANFGAPLSGFKVADLAVHGTVFQIGVAPSRIDILTSIDGVEFSDAWNGRIEVEVEGIRVNVIGRSHLIANKKAVGRPQDLADIA
ncbi:MAG: hypothetical protein ACREQP_04575, partial [Candidatus Binatia bacterium]